MPTKILDVLMPFPAHEKIFALLKPVLSLILFATPIVFGVVCLVLALKFRQEPQQKTDNEIPRSLRIVEVQPVTFIPKAVGFGESASAPS